MRILREFESHRFRQTINENLHRTCALRGIIAMRHLLLGGVRPWQSRSRGRASLTSKENFMAKGQIRSNREQKKPKKDKTKTVVPAAPFGGSKGHSPIQTPANK